MPENTFDLMKLLGWIVPFLLGLLSAIVIDTIRSKIRRAKLKKFTIKHLKNEILPQTAKLKSEFDKVHKYVTEMSNERIPVKVFENLNSSCLEIADNIEYYTIFGNDFSKFNEIKSTINFLVQNLPYGIVDKYFTTVNTHLKEKNVLGDMQHVKTCDFCIDSREYTVKTIELRLKEMEELNSKILDLTKNDG